MQYIFSQESLRLIYFLLETACILLSSHLLPDYWSHKHSFLDPIEPSNS